MELSIDEGNVITCVRLLRKFFENGIYSYLVPEGQRWLFPGTDEELAKIVVGVAKMFLDNTLGYRNYLKIDIKRPLEAFNKASIAEFKNCSKPPHDLMCNSMFMNEHIQVFVCRMFGMPCHFQNLPRKTQEMIDYIIEYVLCGEI